MSPLDNAANTPKLYVFGHDEHDAEDPNVAEDADELQPVEIDSDLHCELDMIQPNYFSCFAHDQTSMQLLTYSSIMWTHGEAFLHCWESI